ncbi:anthranilate phosphoribosyltransferase [Thiosocius teredinicola]|uniref:anthranilate phosphoribosyltransferase n=1 Tax=Thiosocius teredinicola TaxID=1973002 RepID=UPI00099132F6
MNAAESAGTTELQQMMFSIIQRIATGPDLSKDISQEEARLGMQGVLNGEIDPVRAGIFLIALRMKRETRDENRGVLQAILDTRKVATAPVNEVVDIADPYDGYNRTIPASPFLAPLLAECGIPAFSHGLNAVGPKYGVTHRHVLAAAGIDVDLDSNTAAARLGDPAIGWAYVDQANYAPGLHDLIELRQRMIKRSVITTVEVLASPIVGRQKTHFVTGYVHKPYPPVYADLARVAGFDSAIIVRGVEGGVIPSLRQSGKYFAYTDGGDEVGYDIEPSMLNIEQENRAVPIPSDVPQTEKGEGAIALTDVDAAAKKAADYGVAALQGEKGPTYDSLVYSGAVVLQHLGKADSLANAGELVRAALDSGKAAARIK